MTTTPISKKPISDGFSWIKPSRVRSTLEIVFKNGIGLDTEKLIQSVQSLVGTR